MMRRKMRRIKADKKLNKILRRIQSYREAMKGYSDEELAGLTVVYRNRLNNGETLEQLLPEAFAAICEADFRILGKFPYDAQILGGIALHYGYLAEMNTGEGKTLVATMPLYLNALTGKSTILVTTNEYLALRDAQEMGQVYRFMGLTVAAGVSERAEDQFSNEEKKKNYDADILYTTHSALGFDYLLNHLVTSARDRFLRDYYYVIIDEADSVLLDSAQTPLVISGSPRVQSNLYELADFFVTTLAEGRDYQKEENKVWLTQEGIRYAESFFRIDNFYGEEYFEINRHVTLALRAHALYEVEKDYMLTKERELQLLDGGSGRMMRGVKLRGGQHQALEVKEKVTVSQENRSVASITYQNLFLLFPKMAGMSGTISDAKEELRMVYGAKVMVIPPNRVVRRRDCKDLFFADADTQFKEALKAAEQAHNTGQPVLIVVSTIGETEYVSGLLLERKIPHSVLNANNAFWEADIIKEAGRRNAVTVATAMAGRGTDIKLGEGVEELGGLMVIGIGRMANVRQERQARGRAGRQGDPGCSRFFVSLQDEIVSKNCSQKKWKRLCKKQNIRKRKLRKIINSAQRLGEELAVLSRRQALDYDLVLQRQRSLIYKIRDRLLYGESLSQSELLHMAEHNINSFLLSQKEWSYGDITRYLLDHISYRLDQGLSPITAHKPDEVRNYLMYKVRRGLLDQKRKLGQPERMEEFIRMAVLQAIDDAWVEQVDYLQQLQAAVIGRTYAQRNPIHEYQKEALESFQRMKRSILTNAMRNILLSNVLVREDGSLLIQFP